MPIGVGREDSQSGRLSDVRALGPRLREDDGQGNWSLLSTLSVRHARATKSHGKVTEKALRLKPWRQTWLSLLTCHPTDLQDRHLNQVWHQSSWDCSLPINMIYCQ